MCAENMLLLSSEL